MKKSKQNWLHFRIENRVISCWFFRRWCSVFINYVLSAERITYTAHSTQQLILLFVFNFVEHTRCVCVCIICAILRTYIDTWLITNNVTSQLQLLNIIDSLLQNISFSSYWFSAEGNPLLQFSFDVEENWFFIGWKMLFSFLLVWFAIAFLEMFPVSMMQNDEMAQFLENRFCWSVDNSILPHLIIVSRGANVKTMAPPNRLVVSIGFDIMRIRFQSNDW